MLLRYIVSNFKSIGNPIEFSMFPTKQNTDNRFLKNIETKAGTWKVLHRAGFWGPNASGKSSFIESIRFARDYIVEGQTSGKGTGINQFKGEINNPNNASLFQFMFYLDRDVFEYGFSMNKYQVCEEWLMELTDKRLELVFSRQTNENGKTEIEITSRLARNKSKDRILAEILKGSIQEGQKNQLFLYKLYDNGIKKAGRIVEWFKNLQVIFPSTKIKALPIQMKANEELRIFITKMLDDMDTGVHGITVASKEIDFHDFAQEMDLPKEFINEIENLKNGIVSLDGSYFVFSENKHKRTTMVQLKFKHTLNNQSVQFNLDEESDGTQRLLDLLPMLFILGKSPMLFFVDEIDRSLHTKLSQFLLDEFIKNSEVMNQIIFTAHDVNLINLQVFRQDEIWFIEKSNAGESQIRPFSDFTIDEKQDTLKAYLNGRFGAVPMIRG